jgi:hypothetical protein
VLRSLEAAGVLSCRVEVLVDHLLHIGDERFVQRQCLGVFHALDIAVERVLDG